MSALREIGQHLYTLDQSGVVEAGSIELTINAIVREFNVIVISLISDVDLIIDVLWSVDGVNFAYEPADSIIHSGSPDHSFYERTVKGIFLKYRIENPDIVDSTDFDMKTYAKSGVNVDLSSIIPPPPDVWWERDPLDLSNTTQVVAPTNGNVVTQPAIFSEINQVNATYLKAGTFIAGGGTPVIFDYNNLTTVNDPAASYNGTAVIGSGGPGDVILRGAGIKRTFACGLRQAIIENTSNPQTNSVSHSCFFALVNQASENVKGSVLMNSYGGTGNPIQLAEANGSNDFHFNLINGVGENTVIRDTTIYTGGMDMQRSVILSATESQLLASSFEKNLYFGHNVEIPNPGGVTLSGCAVITDYSNGATPLPLTAAPLGSGLVNRWHSRFSQGYLFYADEDCQSGIELLPGGGTQAICDERYKKNLTEYTETESILERLVDCRVCTYHNKSFHDKDPVEEEKKFRITPTAQDFNYVFHPEQGDAATINAARKVECTEQYKINRKNVKCKLWEEANPLPCPQERLDEIEGEIDVEIAAEGLTFQDEPEEEEYRRGCTCEKVKKWEKENPPAIPQETLDQFDTDIDGEILDPEVDKIIERDSMMTLSQQEYFAALHLSIKELNKQVELLKARCDALEGV
jgi:hypothetical protein